LKRDCSQDRDGKDEKRGVGSTSQAQASMRQDSAVGEREGGGGGRAKEGAVMKGEDENEAVCKESPASNDVSSGNPQVSAVVGGIAGSEGGSRGAATGSKGEGGFLSELLSSSYEPKVRASTFGIACTSPAWGNACVPKCSIVRHLADHNCTRES